MAARDFFFGGVSRSMSSPPLTFCHQNSLPTFPWQHLPFFLRRFGHAVVVVVNASFVVVIVAGGVNAVVVGSSSGGGVLIVVAQVIVAHVVVA